MEMKLIKKMGLMLLTGAVLSGTAFAGENAKVKAMVSESIYERLINEGSIADYRYEATEKFALLPKSVYSEGLHRTMIKKEPGNFPYTYEGLHLIKKADLLKQGNSGKTTITLEDISKVVRSLSTMEGMTYYSTTRNKEMVLFKRCYMIAGAGDKTKVPDQNTGNADGQISYCLQDDSSFGENTYRLTYHQNEDSLWCNFTILDKMGIGPFRPIHPGKMIINILVTDCGDDILLYLCTDTDCLKLPGIKGQITKSMIARMTAVYEWFKTQF